MGIADRNWLEIVDGIETRRNIGSSRGGTFDLAPEVKCNRLLLPCQISR